jgi:Amt family ammonium transporter
LFVGARKDYGHQAIVPQNVPFTLLGTGLLWLGWFGFNGGSALGANTSAALAFVNTMLAPMGTLFVWMMLDLMRNHKATAVGAATAVVVGLVAITPAAGFISPLSAIVLGCIAAVPSYYALLFRARTRLDDSLDVLAAHGVGGIVGALLTGILAEKKWNGVANGALFGNPRQFGIQVIAVIATIAFSAVMTFVILQVITLIVRVRASAHEQGIGLDISQHGEEAYSRGEGAILIMPEGGTVDEVSTGYRTA